MSAATATPSSAGRCQVCGRLASKRYGGEGKHLVMCFDCWFAEGIRLAAESARAAGDPE